MSRFTWKIQVKNKTELIASLSKLHIVDEFALYHSSKKKISEVQQIHGEVDQTIQRPMLICFVKLKEKKSSHTINKELQGNAVKIWHPKKMIKNPRRHYQNYASFQYFKNNLLEPDTRGDFDFFEQIQFKMMVLGKKLSQIISDAFGDQDTHLFAHLIQNWKSYNHYNEIFQALRGPNDHSDVLATKKCKCNFVLIDQ